MKINTIGMENNNLNVAVNLLINSKNGIDIARRKRKSSKQANLLMIVNGENKHFTSILKA